MKKILLLICLALAISACKRDEPLPAPRPAAPPTLPLVIYPAKNFLVESVTPLLVETTAEALPLWRHYAPGRPTLVLLAAKPALRPYPEELKSAISELVKTAEQPELRRKTISTVANPLLLPDMALSAALDAGFFAQVIWSIPLQPETTLSLEQFRAELIAQKVLSVAEAAAFREEGGSFVGTIRNIPFLATTKEIPAQSGPVLLHIDLTYLQPGYQGEIRTPLHLHLRETLKKLRTSRLQVIASTIALSNLSGELPLSTRFLGGMIRDIFVRPQQLDQAPTALEVLRADAMYRVNFFRKEEIVEKYLLMEKAAPLDPSVKYDLYQSLRQVNRTDESLQKLQQAVVLDSIYCLEYLDLAELAMEKKRPEGALQMCTLAAKIFPENPFIPFFQARIYLELGQREKVKELLSPLQAMTWSKVYFPEMKDEIAGLLAAAQKPGK